MSKHINNGCCPECTNILGKYHGFNKDLGLWFTNVQYLVPELHISCAGRGRFDQETCYQLGTSKAHYGHSAHNYNCAIDTFFNIDGKTRYDKELYYNKLVPHLNSLLKWYGYDNCVFKERPHIEVANWKSLVDRGYAKKVE